VFKWVFWLFFLDCVLLGYCGHQRPEGTILLIGRLATAFYFIFFLILLPLISWLEKPMALPRSISAPVLKAKEQA
jgi:quinol-cytochrome oxidoreductase complex cytochrome b subunit